MNIFNKTDLDQAISPPEEKGCEICTPPEEIERQAVLEILKQIIDPELGINVVDLGLVYKVESFENAIHVEMTMTTRGCPMHESIIGAAERALKTYFPTRIADVQLVWEPSWTTARLSPEAQAQLGRY
ncbi:MAG TPA: metal-sulfur cluster assembly factor [Candidatus Kapabacteria bacterium]|nr:metal-sulfur cluster assembly factor [Candidatus Kapabacteria bacterium]